MATEKRLIDANALSSIAFQIKQYEKGIRCVVDLNDVDDIPIVDAVEVVRCKDCKHHGGVVYGNRCKKWSSYHAGLTYFTDANDFCSYGERRTDV